jgi:hypothetical protein
MLNAGFRRGARVPRIVDAKTNSFREFNVYAPRVLAGIRGLSTTLADRSLRNELIRKRLDVKMERFSPRQQGEQLMRLRDNLHLAALQHAKEISDAYNRAVDFFIPAEIDDRLRDIVEPLFAIAVAADANDGSQRLTNAVIEATNKLAGIRIEQADDDAASLIGLNALNAIIRKNGWDPVISSSGAFALFRRTDGLEWIDTKDKARAFLRRLGFRSGVHRLERFIAGDRPATAGETERGYEIKFDIVKEMFGQYADVTSVTRSRIEWPLVRRGE